MGSCHAVNFSHFATKNKNILALREKMGEKQPLYPVLQHMTAETAFIPVSLTETLQPPVLGKLVEYAAKERLSHGQVIARALTEFFANRQPSPLSMAQPATGAAEVAA